MLVRIIDGHLGAKPKKLKAKPVASKTNNAAAKDPKSKKSPKTTIGTDINTVDDAETKAPEVKGAPSDKSPEDDKGNHCSACLDMTYLIVIFVISVVMLLVPYSLMEWLTSCYKMSNTRHAGWVCSDCRKSSSQKIKQLQAALSVVGEQSSDVMSTVDQLQEKLANKHRYQ